MRQNILLLAFKCVLCGRFNYRAGLIIHSGDKKKETIEDYLRSIHPYDAFPLYDGNYFTKSVRKIQPMVRNKVVYGFMEFIMYFISEGK